MKKLLGSLVLLGALFAGPAEADAPAPATRITITTARELPDPEALVKALERPGDRHEVRARVQREGEQRTLTLELWGNLVAGDQIESVLRERFPALADAQIAIAPLEEPAPAIDEQAPRNGHRVIIKKEVRDTDDDAR